MEDKPCRSRDAGEASKPLQDMRWSKDLHLLPKLTHALLQEHLGIESNNDACKHKKLGYRLFKDKYVNRVQGCEVEEW